MSSDSQRTRSPARTYGTGRVEAFSDGVIAVAITLLVLDLRVPQPVSGVSLAHRLGELWPNYLAYVISFLAIGIMWLNHHSMMQRLKAVDHSAMVLNLLLLLCIAGLPFTTSVFASYLQAGPDGHLAAVIYAGSFLVTSVMFMALQWLLVMHRPLLLREPLTPMQQRSILLRGTIAVPVYLLAALAGLLTPYLTLAVCLCLGLFYLLPLRPSVRLGDETPNPPQRGHDGDA